MVGNLFYGELYFTAYQGANSSCNWEDLDITVKSNSNAYNLFSADTATIRDSSVTNFIGDFATKVGTGLSWQFGGDTPEPSLEDIQKNLINQGTYILKKDAEGNTHEENGYAKYNSFLVYESADSSDIVGIILVRDSSPIDTTIE